MEIDNYDDGIPSWVDFASPDIDATSAFYSALFGWEIQEGLPEAGGYRLCMLRDRPVAGLMPRMSPDVPPVWLTYVNVDDADDAMAKALANGGQTIVEPMDVLDVGRMALFADPAGAALGLWQPGTHKGAGIVNEPGTYCWSELITTDTDAAGRFYGAVFGWGTDVHPMPMGEYTEWKIGDHSVGGMMAKPPTMPAEVPPFWGVYFAVDDCDKTAARITELGGSTMFPPMDIEPGRFTTATDPHGGIFSILALKSG